MDDEE